jgi:hypothetical protein
MSLPIAQPVTQYFGLDGLPLDNGYIYIGVANSNPIDFPIDVFWDSAGTVPAAQPIRTVAGYPARSGSPAPIFIDEVSFSLEWQDEDGLTIATLEEVPVPIVTASAFGISLVESANAAAARVLLGVEIGTDVQAYDADIPTVVATEAQMRAGVLTSNRTMTPALVADAIDELGTKVKVSADDTTSAFLEDKIVAGDNITVTVLNPGADETIRIAVTGGEVVTESSGPAVGETDVELTGLPTGINGFIISWANLSILNVDPVYIQLGTSAGYQITSYVSTRVDFNFVSTYAVTSDTAGFHIGAVAGGYPPLVGCGLLTFHRRGGNSWIVSGTTSHDSVAGEKPSFYSGNVSLVDSLEKIRIHCTTAFTNGNVRVSYWR